ncbi:MAG: class I SAM-dependent methyltransferase [Elainellaceae cyanobacterium]
MTAVPLSSQLIASLLNIRPLAAIAKHQARRMIISRAEALGIPWRAEVERLQSHQPQWEETLEEISNPEVTYPDYYCRSFHAYDEGNLGWAPALEVDVAAQAVHARLWPSEDGRGDIQGDVRLRQAYHRVLRAHLPQSPEVSVDLGCSAGASTAALQQAFPDSRAIGVDLSPYFLVVARHCFNDSPNLSWRHGAAEATGLEAASVDLVSAFLLFHELPQSAAIAVLEEAQRILRPGGHIAIMGMNPASPAYAKMPAYVRTLLRSTEPYLDEYFTFDLEGAIAAAGFERPKMEIISPRHRALIAQVSRAPDLRAP